MSSIESNHKSVLKAARGQDVCIKIDPIPGEAPKMYGRHFDHTDVLVSKVSCSVCLFCSRHVLWVNFVAFKRLSSNIFLFVAPVCYGLCGDWNHQPLDIAE